MSKRRALLLTAVIVIALGVAGYWFISIPATAVPDGAVSQSRYHPGPFEVISESFEVVDEHRVTQAYGDFSGLPSRTLAGEIWRPAGRKTPGPLLIYSHGYMSFHLEGLYLARFLASHGYTVVAVNYPLTGFIAPDGPLASDVANQPGDISFIIDTLLRRNGDNADALHDTIDPDRIAAAGVSLGGLTTMLATFHRRWHDPRIAAAISIAGPSSVFSPRFFSGRDVPFLLIYGDSDAIVAYRDNAMPLLDKYPDSILVTLVGASHAGFAQPASTLMRFMDNPDVVGCREVVDNLNPEISASNGEFLQALGDAEDGIATDSPIAFCTTELIPRAMDPSRQHMFTTLAAHAFLDSVFADTGAEREQARHYLLETLARENGSELSVKLAPDSGEKLSHHIDSTASITTDRGAAPDRDGPMAALAGGE